MFFSKLDTVAVPASLLGEVEYQERFGLIDDEKLAQPSHELALALFFCAGIVAEVQRAPLDLHDRELANMVPDRDRCSKVVVEDASRVRLKITYATEPQLNPTSRYLESLIDIEVGAPRSSVLSFVGTSLTLRLHRYSEPDVEK